ncbi:MAG: hypothetical protein M3Y74_10960 [Chloroflexota bacterium]|nr:hypothetical protein [Chloroflexota bacterium]
MVDGNASFSGLLYDKRHTINRCSFDHRPSTIDHRPSTIDSNVRPVTIEV